MALMVSSLYDALRSANVPEDKARRASEEVADFDGRVNGVERTLARLELKVESRFSLLQWMLAFNLAMTTAILLRLFW